ncbi:hypothetical protein [uncultured Paraglaciecola sp.]|uniref:hypothetical protein n=1 Tax=uncultured Paraglaciecola sp. TaxID=1765024 RepID=UPI0026103528|nr:hypothetical protein [uncultured Paraglaciecola sp.]
MTVRTTVGTTLKVTSAAPATFDVAGYAALTFTTVGEITNLGEFGSEATLITHSSIDNKIIRKFKGSVNIGSMNMTLGLDTDDAGQILMKAGQALDLPSAFELTTQNGDIYYFQAMIMSFKPNPAGVDDVLTASCTLELTGQSGGTGIVEDLAA